jgi:uncharacterized protein YecE (DUF72 family)
LPDYLVGTGGWAYFKTPNISPLKAYSKIFNFVEVNNTFYHYPETRTVESWRRTVPDSFTFSVKCNRELTHKIGLRPTDEAYEIFYHMQVYCKILASPYLVLETPPNYQIDNGNAQETRDFLSALNIRDLHLIWEYRAPLTTAVADLMQDFNIIHCVDISRENLAHKSDITYSRLFGKGKHNIYQFTDDELCEIDNRAQETNAKKEILAYHGPKMHSDALRFSQFKKTGKFMQVTDFTGAESARAVLAEDASFPSTKAQLIENQGWKVIDLTAEQRVHLADELTKIPEKTYSSLNEVVDALGAVI